MYPRTGSVTSTHTVRKEYHHFMKLTCLAGLLHLPSQYIGAAIIPSAWGSVLASSMLYLHASHTATRKCGANHRTATLVNQCRFGLL